MEKISWKIDHAGFRAFYDFTITKQPNKHKTFVLKKKEVESVTKLV